jgi:hypothetical protein
LLSGLVAVAPKGLVETVAGLALLSTLGAALATAVADDLVSAPSGYREAAVATFLVTASGIEVAGIGSAFWGLVVGLLLAMVLPGGLGLDRLGPGLGRLGPGLGRLGPGLGRLGPGLGRLGPGLDRLGPGRQAGHRPSTRFTAPATREGRP